MDNNITKHNFHVSKKDRNVKNGHNSFLVLFTGLSGSGKSTIASALEKKLIESNYQTYILDGDNVRSGLNSDLDFTPANRSENIRRIAELANLFIDAGIITLASFIAPYKKDRLFIEQTVNSDNFVEVFVNTSLDVCEARDVKGLYKKARAGEIPNFTGVSAPYENPENPFVELNEKHSVQESVELILEAIKEKINWNE